MSPYDASKGGLPDLMKAPKSPVIQDLQSIVRLSQELSAERARADSITAKLAKWNILVASGCTPGGSEFHDDPERTAAFIKQCRADLEERWRKYKRESNSLTASITAACAGTGCLNAHELAEALREERAKLAVTEADVTHYQEMLRVSEEALKQAQTAGRVLAASHYWRSEGAVAFLNSDKMVMWVNMKVNDADDAVQSNPTARAWLKQAHEEASNG